MKKAVDNLNQTGKSGATTVPFTEETYAYFAEFMVRKSSGFALNPPNAQWTATEFKGEALDEIDDIKNKIVN